jgi:tocopherol O-methyltransferase
MDTKSAHDAVAKYYDDTLDLYDDLWGEHIHHGYWDEGDTSVERHAAQQRTVRELAAFAGVVPGSRVLDAGCGVGGPAIHLAAELGCTVEGVTLSERQVGLATDKAERAGVADRTRFRQLDALATDYPDGSFDAVWALESLELMADKEAFLAEALRVLRPGGRLAVTTWCVRDGELTPPEAKLLRKIHQHYELPYILPLSRYRAMVRDLGYQDVCTADWSARVRHTYDTGITGVTPLGEDRTYLLELARRKGVAILRFFASIPLMKEAYELDVLQYGAIRAVKAPA